MARNALDALTRQPFRYLRSGWPWRSVGYLLSGGLLACAGVGVLFLTAALLPGPELFRMIGAGVPAAGCVAVLGPALERRRLSLVDREPFPAPPAATGGVLARLRERATWRESWYALASALALWWIDLGVVVVSLGIPAVLCSAPFQPMASTGVAVLGPVGGALLLPVAAYPITAWAGARAVMSRSILFPDDDRLTEVVRSRARLVGAFDAERRRLERDLHDGAQQRLVALTMKLGLAGLDVPAGSPAARHLAEAQEQTKAALAELRELIRGVHPQILTERGLPAAVRDVAGRSVVPVDTDVELTRRLPAEIEITAYFVVSEALANVAKHSGAGRAAVRGRMDQDVLRLEITDTGKGGADPAGGSGLTGLADRIAVVNGRMLLSSPMGGPTLLRVEIPCGNCA